MRNNSVGVMKAIIKSVRIEDPDVCWKKFMRTTGAKQSSSVPMINARNEVLSNFIPILGFIAFLRTLIHLHN
jgi:hypothetical protein